MWKYHLGIINIGDTAIWKVVEFKTIQMHRIKHLILEEFLVKKSTVFTHEVKHSDMLKPINSFW